VSPAIAKTSDRDIIAAARRLIKQRGADELTLQDVAQAVGIKAPSLYKRFKDRTALLRAVKDDALTELETVLRKAADDHPAPVALKKMAFAYRRFGKRQPEIYRLIYRPELKDATLEPERKAAAPALELMTALLGPRVSLAAARCITSFLHGFVLMEITGNFRLGESVDAAFDFSIEVILNGLMKS
jgi:AcrR family transcriptional regulator